MRAASTGWIRASSPSGASTDGTGRRASGRWRPSAADAARAARRRERRHRMSARAAFVLGCLLALAALLHGGIYSAGRDFVVNRFTGAFQFVPADDDREDEDTQPARGHAGRVCLDAARTGG